LTLFRSGLSYNWQTKLMYKPMDDLAIVGAAIEDKYISAGLVDFTDRKVVPNTLRRKRVDPGASADEIIEKWVECIRDVMNLTPEKDLRIGIGIPNLIDYESGLYLDNNPKRYGSLYQKNIKNLLGEQLGISPEGIQIKNIAASFFQGEVFAGAGRGYKRSFGITLGMGLGTARYKDGKVEDANLWKTPFKGSIAEDHLSLRFLVNRFAELSGIEVADVPEIKSFHPNPFVEQTFKEFGENLGDFIIQVANQERPDMILVGGQMESSYRFFFDIAVNRVRAAGITVPIVKAILGERAYVIGAAAIWNELQLH
jgi:glucokinase